MAQNSELPALVTVPVLALAAHEQAPWLEHLEHFAGPVDRQVFWALMANSVFRPERSVDR
ncbi:MAG: hypothetical protein WKF77_03530 [Planctomycetaceae bacterium]